MKLNSHQLRKSRLGDSLKKQSSLKRNHLVLVLDNVLDTYNIGSCVTPPNIKIHRASIGTWKWVPWQHYQNTKDCLKELKKAGYQLVACEQTKNSQNYRKIKYQNKVALIAGSEMYGISKEILNLVDTVAEIPMYGVNISLNVLVASSLIGFQIVETIKS